MLTKSEWRTFGIYACLGMSMLIMLSFTIVQDIFHDDMTKRYEFFTWFGHKFVKPIGEYGQPGYWDAKLYLSSYVNDISEYVSRFFILIAAFLASRFRIFFVLGILELGHALDYAVHFGYPFGFVHGWPVVYVHAEVFLFAAFSIIYIIHAKRS